jgi:nucleotide-binding universal stress UspA family protein
MYQGIVVGTDGSDGALAAVEHAAELARLTGSTLYLVQGCGSAVLAAPMYGEVPAIDHREVVQACTDELDPLAGRLRTTGIEVEVHVVAAAGHVAVCDVAESVHADLIVVGNRGMTGARRLLGSVPNSIAHRAPCSVLIVHTH